MFDRLIDSWFPLIYVLNNLNRGLGLPDAYPFVLSPPAVEKLRFVHDTVTAVSSAAKRRANRSSKRRVRNAVGDPALQQLSNDSDELTPTLADSAPASATLAEP